MYIAAYSIACGRMKGMPTRCGTHVCMEACIASYVCVRTDGFTCACAFFLQPRSHVSLLLCGSRKQRAIPITHGRRPYAMYIACLCMCTWTYLWTCLCMCTWTYLWIHTRTSPSQSHSPQVRLALQAFLAGGRMIRCLQLLGVHTIVHGCRP